MKPGVGVRRKNHVASNWGIRRSGLATALAVAMAVPVAAVLAGSATPAGAATSIGGQLNAVSCASASFCMGVGTSVGGTTTLTESWNGSVWSVIPSPNQSSSANDLAGVSCLSSLDCVAVGTYTDSAGDPQGFALIWNGSSWSVVSTSAALGGDISSLSSVSCTQATSVFCVAVGFVGPTGTPTSGAPDQPLVESWNGSSWSVMSTPEPAFGDGQLQSVSCSGAVNCMAVGQTVECAPIIEGGTTHIVCFSSQMLVESWDGTNWSIQTTPNENATSSLFGISCASSMSCVGIGGSSTGVVVDSWNGTSWTVTNGPAPSAGSELDGVSCTSPTNCMTAGESASPSPGVDEQTWALLWNGTALSSVPSANPSSAFDGFNGVSCTSATFCVAVGSMRSSTSASPQPLFETWNGTTWSVAPSANTAILIPSAGTAEGRTSAILDAAATASAGVATVQFALTGGTYSRTVIGTATPTSYGYILVWNTTGIPGGTYTLQSLVTDEDGGTAYSPGVTITVDNTPPTTAVIFPSTGANLQGTSALLDATASASDGVAIGKVQFALTGGSYTKTIVGTAAPTYYGYLFELNTTSIRNGSYVLQSLATDAAGNTAYSLGITITVANSPPTTAVISPSTGVSLQGTNALLDATASASDGGAIGKVQFALTGGPYSQAIIGTATPTYYGYLFQWNTTSIVDGQYSLQSLATDAAGNTAFSPAIKIKVTN
jgi:hypothetical protein